MAMLGFGLISVLTVVVVPLIVLFAVREPAARHRARSLAERRATLRRDSIRALHDIDVLAARAYEALLRAPRGAGQQGRR